jgi:hypothetical protein
MLKELRSIQEPTGYLALSLFGVAVGLGFGMAVMLAISILS